MKVVLSILLVLLSLNTQAQSEKPLDSDSILLSSNSILRIVNQSPDSGTIVINFWATWCGPCIHEMPFFVKADTLLKGENVKFIFVSFDKSSDTKRVTKYVMKNGIPGTHYLITYTDLNTFINQVDPNWEGGIPYTVVLKKDVRRNNEGAFDSFKDLWHFIRD